MRYPYEGVSSSMSLHRVRCLVLAPVTEPGEERSMRPGIIVAFLLATAVPGRADPKLPFPHEAAGFRFGIAPPEFKAQCKQLGKPSAVEGDHDEIHHRTCDAVEVQPGWRWSVFAGFCDHDSRLCEIQYFSTNQFAARD